MGDGGCVMEGGCLVGEAMGDGEERGWDEMRIKSQGQDAMGGAHICTTSTEHAGSRQRVLIVPSALDVSQLRFSLVDDRSLTGIPQDWPVPFQYGRDVGLYAYQGHQHQQGRARPSNDITPLKSCSRPPHLIRVESAPLFIRMYMMYIVLILPQLRPELISCSGPASPPVLLSVCAPSALRSQHTSIHRPYLTCPYTPCHI
jgi:hypothetical protein